MQPLSVISELHSGDDFKLSPISQQAAFASSFTQSSINRRPRSPFCASQPWHNVPTTLNKLGTKGGAFWVMTHSQPPSPCLSVDASVMKALANRRIVITGGTGLIGRSLVSRLSDAKADVCLLARNPSRAQSLFESSNPTVFQYDAQQDTPLTNAARQAVLSADAVINLAGEPIDVGRWTPQRKRVLRDSRIVGTRRLVEVISKAEQPPVLVNASAVGFYGASETNTFVEDAPAGSDFLAETAKAWECAALANTASRTVVLRIGVVLGNGGGALQKMSPLFRAFLGGPPGSGRQWFSWVHLEDVVRLMLHATVDEKWTGVYNATAPQPVRLKTFCEELGRALGRPSWLPVPKQAVQMLLGTEAAQLVLAGQQVLPKRTRANGFVYQYKDIRSALQNLTHAVENAELTRM